MSNRSKSANREKTVLVAVKLPMSLAGAVEAHLSQDPEANRSRFFRSAVREKLAREQDQQVTA